MFLDATLSFNTNFGTAAAITTTGTLGGMIDVTAAGSGNAPRIVGGFPQLSNDLGVDYGQADGEALPWVVITVTVAGTGAGTITFTLEAAPDNGSFSPGTYTTLGSTAAFVGTSRTLGTVIAFRIPPYLMQGEGQPRFYALVATVSGSATVSVLANITLNAPSSLRGFQFNNNFAVA